MAPPVFAVLDANDGLPFGPWGFPLFFLSLWAFISLILSFVGGWMSLAKAYPHQGQATGKLFRFRSASLRWGTTYNHCLTFGVSQSGLYVAQFFPFRLFHHALFIPWHDIQSRPFNQWFFSGVELVTNGMPAFPIRISTTLAWELSSESNHGFELKSAALGL